MQKIEKDKSTAASTNAKDPPVGFAWFRDPHQATLMFTEILAHQATFVSRCFEAQARALRDCSNTKDVLGFVTAQCRGLEEITAICNQEASKFANQLRDRMAGIAKLE